MPSPVASTVRPPPLHQAHPDHRAQVCLDVALLSSAFLQQSVLGLLPTVVDPRWVLPMAMAVGVLQWMMRNAQSTADAQAVMIIAQMLRPDTGCSDGRYSEVAC